MSVTGPTDSERAELAALTSRLAEAGFALPGTLIERRARCGKRNCRCHADPPRLHGPYWQWTRKNDGKTITVNLTEDQAARYQPWFDTASNLRDALARIEELTLRIASRDENWPESRG
jgi:hypothetical protein